jgi:squalene-associated FAD-dependent desaturase
LQERLAVPVLKPDIAGGEPSVAWIRRGMLPSPVQLGPSLFTYRHLSLGDRLRVGRAVLALRNLRSTDASLDEETFAEFLLRHGQRPRAIEALWDLITLPTLNVHAGEASLALAAKVFKTGFLDEADAADIGWSRVPLSKLHVDPAVEVLKRAGAAIHRRAKVSSVDLGDVPASSSHKGAISRIGSPRRAVGVTADGEHVASDAVVLAVQHEAAAELLPKGGAIDPSQLCGLGHSPIVDVHVVYDRKVTGYAIAAGLDTPVQYVFDRTQASGMDAKDGQCLAVSVSGADDEHGMRPEVLIERYTAALGELFPKAREASILDAVVTREHTATFRGVPGTARLRPSTMTGFDALYLAGAWLDTGWPATMEGAVRSGIAASAQVLRSFGFERATSKLPEEVVA